jgi:hypothetical protein
MSNPDVRRFVQFTKERFAKWNFIKKNYSSINILEEYNIFEEKVILSPQNLKLTVNKSCVVTRITIKRPQKNKLPSKSVKPLTIRWTNQWKRFDEETAKLKTPDKKPPDKLQDFELIEDHIHKRKIKLEYKQLNSFLNESKIIILKIQEMLIWKDNLERWHKEKDRQHADIQKMETEFCSINLLKEKIINIGKTKNKRKKKQSELDLFIDEDYMKCLCLKINQKIDETTKSSLYNYYKIRCDMWIHTVLKNFTCESTMNSLNRLTGYMDNYIIEMKKRMFAIRSVQEFKFITSNYKILKKKRKVIKYIEESTLLNSESKPKQIMLNWNAQEIRKRMISVLKNIPRTSACSNLVRYIIESDYEEMVKAETIFATFDSNHNVEAISEVNQPKKKLELFQENLKKKRAKQKLQLFDRRKVRLTFSAFQSFTKKASLIYFFNFFNDISWPATKGEVEILFSVSKGNYLIKNLQNNSKQQFDMAAMVALNASKATGVQIGTLFGKILTQIVLDNLS